MVAAAGAPFKFAPAEGPGFFAPLGWKPAQVASLLKTAGRLKRLPIFLKADLTAAEPPKPCPTRVVGRHPVGPGLTERCGLRMTRLTYKKQIFDSCFPCNQWPPRYPWIPWLTGRQSSPWPRL